MGTDPFNYDQAVSAEGIMDLYRCHSNAQHFQRAALQWAGRHDAVHVAPANPVAEVADDLSAPPPTNPDGSLGSGLDAVSDRGQNEDPGDSDTPTE